MTKSEELDHLRAFTASLDTDTYLRPWLESVLPEVEREIRCDFPLSPSVEASRKQAIAEASEIMVAATEKANNIVAAAEAKARKMEDRASSYQSRVANCLSSMANRLYEV